MAAKHQYGRTGTYSNPMLQGCRPLNNPIKITPIKPTENQHNLFIQNTVIHEDIIQNAATKLNLAGKGGHEISPDAPSNMVSLVTVCYSLLNTEERTNIFHKKSYISSNILG